MSWITFRRITVPVPPASQAKRAGADQADVVDLVTVNPRATAEADATAAQMVELAVGHGQTLARPFLNAPGTRLGHFHVVHDNIVGIGETECARPIDRAESGIADGSLADAQSQIADGHAPGPGLGVASHHDQRLHGGCDDHGLGHVQAFGRPVVDGVLDLVQIPLSGMGHALAGIPDHVAMHVEGACRMAGGQTKCKSAGGRIVRRHGDGGFVPHVADRHLGVLDP